MKAGLTHASLPSMPCLLGFTSRLESRTTFPTVSSATCPNLRSLGLHRVSYSVGRPTVMDATRHRVLVLKTLDKSTRLSHDMTPGIHRSDFRRVGPRRERTNVAHGLRVRQLGHVFRIQLLARHSQRLRRRRRTNIVHGYSPWNRRQLLRRTTRALGCTLSIAGFLPPDQVIVL